MMKFVAFALIGAAFSAPVAAAPAPSNETSFTRDGLTYYVTQVNKRGYTRISGHDSDGHKFDLRTTGNNVDGRYGDSPVSFRMPAAPGSGELAAR